MPTPWTSGRLAVNLELKTSKGKLMTRIQTLLFAGTFAFTSLLAAAAKSYDIELKAPVMAGKVQLKPGKYTLSIQGSNAVFTDKGKQSYVAPVKVENGTKKFRATIVDSDGQGAVGQIKYIELGDSTLTLEFVD
jgi:hypothetical protein